MDFAYYGNTVSSPLVLHAVSPNDSLITETPTQLAIFAIAAAPGYFVAAAMMDRIGRKTIQILGFAMMAMSFAAIAVIPGVEKLVYPFLIIYGISYFFTEFGPNATTFVYPAERFPVEGRTTGHGIASAAGKLGGFIGVFLFQKGSLSSSTRHHRLFPPPIAKRMRFHRRDPDALERRPTFVESSVAPITQRAIIHGVRWRVRIFKTKPFVRFAKRESLDDASLVRAVFEIERGLVDADLGGGVIKKRVARLGRGKSGGYRMLIAVRARHRAVFLFGFAKATQRNNRIDRRRHGRARPGHPRG